MAKAQPGVLSFSLLSDFDIQLFKSGKHFRLYEKLGSHIIEVEGQKGTYFAVWAPNAEEVSVSGSFNFWSHSSHRLNSRWDGSGIWEGFIPGIGLGTLYKYSILARGGHRLEKGDPFAFHWETPPKTASVVWDLDYSWKDKPWMNSRKDIGNKYSVYEVHLGSWKKILREGGRSLSYKELQAQLVPYVKEMGFTHVELMPVMEHPFFGSWGYQVTGYYAPSGRFGTPQEFMDLVNAFHDEGIGVILDWVPSHFPEDGHGLAQFDGTHLFDHEDPQKGFHPDWKSAIFNYGRLEVRAFLISNALFWLDKFHIDGIRVDAVASMLYLDYSREEGQWIPNEFGGNENLEAISFLKEMNETVYKEFPDAVTIAEESTAWPGVSRPTFSGGLGFGQKWMMGWMHDTLKFFQRDPIYRKFHHSEISFSMVYAFTENFMLPLSHDEVVHGKGSLIGKMPGDEWQRFANLRLMFGYMYSHPGTKLLFMGGEFGQTAEWSHDRGLEWDLLEYDFHKGIQQWVRDLNKFYKSTPAMHEFPFTPEGFEWIDLGDWENCTIVFLRKGKKGDKSILVVCNLTPTVHRGYRVGVPQAGLWSEKLNSDNPAYGGSGIMNDPVLAEKIKTHGRDYSISLTLPPLGIVALERNPPPTSSSKKVVQPKEKPKMTKKK